MRQYMWRRAIAAFGSVCLAIVMLAGGLSASAAPAQPAPAAPPSSPQALSAEQIYKETAPAVVFITEVDSSGKVLFLGSGFIVSPSGVIVTNAHMVKPVPGGAHLQVQLTRGDTFNDVRMIFVDDRRDFAVISIAAAGLPAVRLGDSDKLEPGNRVYTIGNPGGLRLSITEGIVEFVRLMPDEGFLFIQHSAATSGGSSGGPLLNARGEVVGVHSFGFTKLQNVNGAIPINYARPYFTQAAKMTWEEYARANPPQPAAPAAGGPAPPAPPSSPAPSSPGAFFARVSMYRNNDGSYKNGFAAGVHDGTSLFAAAAQSANSINRDQALALFGCLDSKGDKLPEFAAWIDSAIAKGPDNGVVADVLVKACGGSFETGRFFYRVSEYRPLGASFKQGFAAGIFDTVSWFAAGKTDGQGAIALAQCLKSKGDKLGQLSAWATSALQQKPDGDSAVGYLVAACQANR